ncbi:MAG TPA: AraC family transcriptional regulator [Thermoanaerobaculia bacterium]|nr:AraC family transcriptional regulator [Thermoanaerobaculia bacterium]
MRLHAGEFLGSALRAHESAGFTLTEYSYAPGAALPRHEHPFAYLSFPLAGSYRERCGSAEWRCSPDSAIFHPKGEVHDDRFDGSATRIFSVEIADAWLERMHADGVRIAARAEITSRAILRAASRLRRLTRGPSSLRIEAAAIDLLATLPAPIESRAPRWLQLAVDYVHAMQPLRVRTPELARIAGVHPVHLARTFRRVHGCTISEYVRNLRVERAMRLLRGGDTLDQIALDAGFADQSHFCREFKRVAGVSPGEFRARR